MTTPTAAELSLAADILRGGGVVLYPTETLYGFGCDAGRGEACARIGSLKGWAVQRPMILLIDGIEGASQVVRWTPAGRRLAEALWPGALTLLLPPRVGEGTVAVRESPHPVVRALVGALGGALTSTSANRTGEPPPRRIQQASWHGPEGPDMVLDSGETAGHRGSTLVDCTGARPRLVRQGDLDPARLAALMEVESRG